MFDQSRNATKFTHEGGRIKVVTKLLWPKLPHSRDTSHQGASHPQTPLEGITEKCELGNGVDVNAEIGEESGPLDFTEDRLHAHNLAAANFETIVVRIEVHEYVHMLPSSVIPKHIFSTGVGIKSKDLKDHKLCA